MSLLRASGQFTGDNYAAEGVMDGTSAVGVPHAALLIALADAALAGNPDAARAAVLSAMGEAAMIDAAAVIGGFDGITRLADASGIPLEPAKAEASAEWRASLGIDRFVTEKN